MALYCVSRYRSVLGEWKPGQEVDADEETQELLLRDSPGSFSREKGEREKGRKGESPGPATLEEMRAFAEANGIDLGGVESEEDVRAAIELWREAQAKVAKAETASGTTTNTRPQRQARKR